MLVYLVQASAHSSLQKITDSGKITKSAHPGSPALVLFRRPLSSLFPSTVLSGRQVFTPQSDHQKTLWHFANTVAQQAALRSLAHVSNTVSPQDPEARGVRGTEWSSGGLERRATGTDEVGCVLCSLARPSSNSHIWHTVRCVCTSSVPYKRFWCSSLTSSLLTRVRFVSGILWLVSLLRHRNAVGGSMGVWLTHALSRHGRSGYN